MSNRVLIVDDNEGIRRLIRVFVESIGLEVCGEAGDGFSGIERAQELNPDVILLDLSMPVMNGAEAASVLKSRMPNVPIVLFTMYEFGEALAAAVGVDVVLCKSDGVSKLAAYLKAHSPTFRTLKRTDTTTSSLGLPRQPSPSLSTRSGNLAPYDIFRVLDHDEVTWLGSSATIEQATALVQSFGERQPGRYIIFNQKTESKITLVAKASTAEA